MERIVERRIEGEIIYSYRIARTYVGMASPTKGARTTHSPVDEWKAREPRAKD